MMSRIKSRLVIRAFALVSLVASVAFAQEPADENAQNVRPQPRLEISKETTVIDGPLTEDGYVDYLAALNEHASRGVTPESNAVVPLMRAFGPNVVPEEIRAEFFQKLGEDVPPLEGDYWTSLHEFYRQQAMAQGKEASALRDELDELDKKHDQAMFGVWTAEQYPVLAKWLATNERPLALVAEAVERPRFYTPFIATGDEGTLVSALLPLAQPVREVSQALMTRAMLRLDRGELEAAWQDLHTLHRLVRLVGQGETLVDALVSIALHGSAVAATATLLHEGKLTTEQLRQVAADLAKLPPLPKMSEKIDVAERYMLLDVVTMMARKDPVDLEELGVPLRVNKLFKLVPTRALDWNLVARRSNHWYDRIVEAARQQPHAERAKALAELQEEVGQLGKEVNDVGGWTKKILFSGGNLRQTVSEQVSSVFLALLVPNFSAPVAAEERAQANTDLLQVAVALALHRAEHGHYPQALAELAAQEPLPSDLYTGQPFHYRRTEQGYLLYSVGPNLKDDGGAGYEHHPNHDIVLRQPRKLADD